MLIICSLCIECIHEVFEDVVILFFKVMPDYIKFTAVIYQIINYVTNMCHVCVRAHTRITQNYTNPSANLILHSVFHITYYILRCKRLKVSAKIDLYIYVHTHLTYVCIMKFFYCDI